MASWEGKIVNMRCHLLRELPVDILGLLNPQFGQEVQWPCPRQCPRSWKTTDVPAKIGFRRVRTIEFVDCNLLADTAIACSKRTTATAGNCDCGRSDLRP